MLTLAGKWCLMMQYKMKQEVESQDLILDKTRNKRCLAVTIALPQSRQVGEAERPIQFK